MTELRKSFGAHLKRLRTSRKLTQEDLAERSGLAVDSIRRIERGVFSPSLDTLSKITQGLQISLRTLFDGVERNKSNVVQELCDFLSHRRSDELRIVERVIRALLDG
ncbi:MAG: helix-turn-helix domain-containing protein [Myxococcaceae bacterium]